MNLSTTSVTVLVTMLNSNMTVAAVGVWKLMESAVVPVRYLCNGVLVGRYLVIDAIFGLVGRLSNANAKMESLLA